MEKYVWMGGIEHKNAENILIARKNPDLAAKYAANWRRHYEGAGVYIAPKKR